MPPARRLDPLAEFQAMSKELHEAARFWLREGFYAPGLTSWHIERLDGWLMRVSMAGPETLAALRKAAGIVPTPQVKRRRKSVETSAAPG
jgi:hypothetical protein